MEKFPGTLLPSYFKIKPTHMRTIV